MTTVSFSLALYSASDPLPPPRKSRQVRFSWATLSGDLCEGRFILFFSVAIRFSRCLPLFLRIFLCGPLIGPGHPLSRIAALSRPQRRAFLLGRCLLFRFIPAVRAEITGKFFSASFFLFFLPLDRSVSFTRVFRYCFPLTIWPSGKKSFDLSCFFR